ncbi:hypothetical protein Tco_1070662 [Tanacetum coccineum]|uniref:Uncharacterized protein n=1 Tax=Tanacetum coccineum TaxID=301880 RepID=A0ABQ5HMC5_9ASTR
MLLKNLVSLVKELSTISFMFEVMRVCDGVKRFLEISLGEEEIVRSNLMKTRRVSKNKGRVDGKGRIQRCFKLVIQWPSKVIVQNTTFNDLKSVCWRMLGESGEEDESKRDEFCLMALDNNEVLSDTPYYSSSSLDSESLQNEYNKLVILGKDLDTTEKENPKVVIKC